MSWQDFLKSSREFARIAFDENISPTVRVQNAFKAVEFAIAAYAVKHKKSRPERGREVLFMELNFGQKAADDFKAVMTSYYDSYGLVSEQRAEYVCSKIRVLLEKIFSALDETL
ncbi:MAG: hypothetical protein QW738_06650 [Nitrososphaeria archaeon]